MELVASEIFSMLRLKNRLRNKGYLHSAIIGAGRHADNTKEIMPNQSITGNLDQFDELLGLALL